MNGVLLVDKPLGYTSHDIVDIVRRKIGSRRVGHAGALDPMATGLLVILVGWATRLFEQFVLHDKEYEGSMTLGIRTDSHDLEGKILFMKPVDEIPESRIRSVFSRFEGAGTQRIPRYSAAKVGGKKYYDLARREISFEARRKAVEIKFLRLVAVSIPDIFFRTCVSKGTYVRTLCDDIGQELGVGGSLSALKRVRSGPFYAAESLPLRELEALSEEAIRLRLVSTAPLAAASGSGLRRPCAPP